MQITIDVQDIEPIIARAVGMALDRFALELRDSFAAANQGGLRNTKQAAKFLDVCEATVKNKIKSGELICRRIGGNVRFTQEDLDDFVSRARATKPAEPELAK